MTVFATSATFTSGTATNRWDPAETVSLAGMRTIAYNRPTLADDGLHVLNGDGNANPRDAMIYDLLFDGKANQSGTSQQFADSFGHFNLGLGDDLLDLTVSPGRQAVYGIANYTEAVSARGGYGADKIWAGYGNDTLSGEYENGTQLVGYSGSSSPAFKDYLHGGDGVDVIYGDFATLDGLTASVVKVGAGNDELHGGRGEDFIYGDNGSLTDFSDGFVATLGAGDDRLFGEAGNDSLYGDSGFEDSFLPASIGKLEFGNDTISGGAGADRIIGDSGIGLVNGVDAGGDDILGGDGENDTIVGDFVGSLERYSGSLEFGHDQIRGGSGRDTLIGDYMSGSANALTGIHDLRFGNDTIFGDSGDDTIYGDAPDIMSAGVGVEAGADTIDGGGGNDDLWGDFLNILPGGGSQQGADVFVFGPGGGTDRIHDFNLGVDKIDVSGYGFRGLPDLNLSTGVNYTTVSFGGGNSLRVDGAAVSGINQLVANDFVFAS